MNPVDIGAIAVIALCGIGCAVKGFVSEFFGTAAIFIGALAAFLFWHPLSSVLPLPASYGWASVLLAIAILFLSGFLLLKLVERGAHESLETMRMGLLDHGLGLFFGLFEGVLVAGVLMGLLEAQPFWNASALLSGSFFHRVVGPYIDLRKIVGHV